MKKMLKKALFNTKCSIIGMVHVDALPGTPKYCEPFEKIVSKACYEAEVYVRHKVDAILVENMHDVPYIQSQHFGPETTASMSRICAEIRRIVPQRIPCGVQVLAGGNKEALAIAKVCSFSFIRSEGFVFSHVADEGFTDATAGPTLRYRRLLHADDVLVFADIKKKHSSHSITSDVSLVDTAKAAEFFLADGVVLTGAATGEAAAIHELKALSKAVSIPVLVGSGVTEANLSQYLQADALIVGSHFKTNGKWSNDLECDRIRKFMDKRNFLLDK